MSTIAHLTGGADPALEPLMWDHPVSYVLVISEWYPLVWAEDAGGSWVLWLSIPSAV